MAGSKSNYLETALLNAVLRNTSYTSVTTVYVALATAVGSDGSTFTEVSGGSYARTAVTFGAPSGNSVANSGAVTFPTATADWGTVVAFGIYDASSGGNQLYWGDLTASKTISNGDTASFAISAMTVTEE